MDFLKENLQVIIAAAAVLLLLLIIMGVWRAFSPRMSGRRGQRLGISEYYELDKTRRLVLLRRDNVEHLVLIGGSQDMVIEPGITAAAIAQAYGSTSNYPEPPAGTARPAPRPPVFSDRKPPPLRPVADPSPAPSRTSREEPEL